MNRNLCLSQASELSEVLEAISRGLNLIRVCSFETSSLTQFSSKSASFYSLPFWRNKRPNSKKKWLKRK